MLPTTVRITNELMGQLQLDKVSKEIIDHAEQGMVAEKGLPKAVDDYFIQRLKLDEMQHAGTNARLYEGLRQVIKKEVLPLYGQYRHDTIRIRERRQNRKLWQYVLGTVCVFEVFEALLSRGRSIAPQVFFPTAILYSFLGFVVYAAAQYIDDLSLAHSRKRLEKRISNLENKVQTDIDYDDRRQLVDADILRAEALEILTHYPHSDDFWRDYRKVRQADPASPPEFAALAAPAFERFLKFHLNGQYSASARQQRFDRLFIEAHEVLLTRDREQYVLDHLKHFASTKKSDSHGLNKN